ncbi:MAG: hypothetical protein HY689_08135, partial [Chloroflexi bacterium]|nr:hypothetical protein [Chloroflexota bacterium]
MTSWDTIIRAFRLVQRMPPRWRRGSFGLLVAAALLFPLLPFASLAAEFSPTFATRAARIATTGSDNLTSMPSGPSLAVQGSVGQVTLAPSAAPAGTIISAQGTGFVGQAGQVLPITWDGAARRVGLAVPAADGSFFAS